MIRDFWVENYLSIGERQSIDFRSKTKADYLTCEVAPGVFLNKLGIFLGSLQVRSLFYETSVPLIGHMSLVAIQPKV